VAVTGHYNQVVLDRERRYPNVVVWDGRTRFSHLHENPRIILGRVTVREENGGIRALEEGPQQPFIPVVLGSA
jgi:hypothetical protein